MVTQQRCIPLTWSNDRARVTRDGLRLVAVLLITALLFAVSAVPAGAAPAANDIGPDRVYFAQTGHYLSYAFLDYWHHNGDIPLFGYPITEEFTDPATGLTVQYFERAVFEYHPDAGASWRVQLRRLGADLVANRQSDAPFKPFVATSNADTTFFPETGHRLSFGFRDYWNAHGGLRIFGYPLSEEFTENGFTVQYFERARFEYHPNNPPAWQVELGLLGANAGALDGVNTTRLPQSSRVRDYDPSLWHVPAPPENQTANVTPPGGAPVGEAKWIEVNLSGQFLRAWQYDTLVFSTAVSTGVATHQTPTGTYHVYSKLAFDDMTGGTTGVDYYDLPNVPNVMYFYQAYAIHGAYWHHNFGHVMSHGCVNLPLDAASWMYGWTPVGTTVWIHW
jgi:hypothetical protein